MSKPKNHLRIHRHSYTIRRVDFREIRQRFLIICEGEKTEPSYFRKFRLPTVVINVRGVGCDPIKLVRKAAEFQEKDDYDQTWCVFDRDDVPLEQFNRAVELAHREHFHIAYSNQAFELWYILHFQYLNSSLTRQDYIHRLRQHLGHEYQKNSPNIYDELLPYLESALQNAARLLDQYHPPQPAIDDPSTTVHLLVGQLLRFSN